MDFFNMVLLAAASRGGGGVTWTMTAGGFFSGGQNNVGYRRSVAGAISSEPIPGHPIDIQGSRPGSPNSFITLSFVGDAVAQISGFTEFVVDGVVYRIQNPRFFSTTTVWETYPDGQPSYVNGQTYVCELR
ncbi:hypothetical protein PhaeoP66_03236 [Phaeobacter inhibens]|uniref:Uncharacterized protein n=1 Tax=Phaeobacter inhibens TaxID=221822 RepID=A0ABM6RHL4_9RHOB|nr:hypothetical protein [Phaeobacter inhibens]AUQ95978.1 hypothetical protein PhaeoP66_03236 [Phaeobacter inhibens]